MYNAEYLSITRNTMELFQDLEIFFWFLDPLFLQLYNDIYNPLHYIV